MAGIVPNEAEKLIADIIFKRVLTDRDANLELGLFTNSTVSESTTLASITEPTGTGYARKTLTDGSWTGTADTRSYATQTFTAGGAWTGSVYGYFIATKASGGTPRLLVLEVDPSGPYTFDGSGDYYEVTPVVSVA